MKAYYKTILKGEMAHSTYLSTEKPEDIREYVLLGIKDVCCEEMREALEEHVIG